MAIDSLKNRREKNWRFIFSRSNNFIVPDIGFEYPRQPVSNLLNAERINVLFVCTMNKWRSPTAEKIYGNHLSINARSRGTSQKARRTITSDDIKWAHVIFVMERKHQQQLQSRFPGEMAYIDTHVLDIPDEYQFMDAELVQCIRDVVDELLMD